MQISEKDFEATIERYLLAFGPDEGPSAEIREKGTLECSFQLGGYHKRTSKDYDRNLCLIPEDVISFLQSTQPIEWARYKGLYRDESRERFLKRLSSEISRLGTLDVLRKGIKDSGCKFKLCYFQPASALNPENSKHYQANIFSVVRQLRFSLSDINQENQKSLDLAIFLNGLPLFTAELKDPLTGQTVQNAISQYQKTRDPREPLFALGRCLAHFALDPELVYFTTQLEGEKTYFLPFNRGNNREAGNPPSYFGFATAYLWEQIWARDSVLEMIQKFIFKLEQNPAESNAKTKPQIIFPRYHQLDAVRRLVTDAKEKGTGKRYLIQHSAGSGKSFSISWLAHQLSNLHDAQDKRVFDSIIVVTDRRVLDRQLQTHVLAFEQTLGLVESIGQDKTAQDLRRALESGKTIIVSTIQKFPVIVDSVGELAGKRFAVIIDEAHSSQGGETSHKMQQVLDVGSLEEAENFDKKALRGWEDNLIKSACSRGLLPNVSYFAFTATPKQRTLELFGTKNHNGEFAAFSLYSMRQAIEEGFILDVLQNYTTYKAYWNLLKKIEDDPAFDRKKANYLLRSFVELHDATLEKKVNIMLDHFDANVRQRVNGRAKAMIITRSRLHAVRYKLAVDRYIRENGLDYQALVAFSGTVKDPADGQTYTESSMNTRSSGMHIPETATAETFKDDKFRIIIVAEKFQTGFDQPLLHTMYVDKKLAGLHAVQTLSRLNRIYPPYKEDVMVLDFANEADDIFKAFQPYYDRTFLEEETDPNDLYIYEERIKDYHLFSDKQLDEHAKVYFGVKSTQAQLLAVLRPVVDLFGTLDKDDKKLYKEYLQKFCRLYSFIGQIARFVDEDLEKLYHFARYLQKLLPIEKEQLPVEILQAIDLTSLRVQQTGEGPIPPLNGGGSLPPEKPGTPQVQVVEKEVLSKIIQELNEKFGTEWEDTDHLPVIVQLENSLSQNIALKNSMEVNTLENARLTFNDVLDGIFQGLINTNFKFYKQINDNDNLLENFRDILFDRYRNKLGMANES